MLKVQDVKFSEHWLKEVLKAIDLANAVVKAADEKNNFSFLYNREQSIKERITEIIAQIIMHKILITLIKRYKKLTN